MQNISLNRKFADMVSHSNQFALVTPPFLALTVFRIEPKATSSEQPAVTLENLNDLNKRFHEQLSARSDVMFTQTSLNGVFCMRMAVGTARTELHHVERGYNILCEEADKVLQEWKRKVADDSDSSLST
jgi:aromatic-L-amino-acid decarboxylase